MTEEFSDFEQELENFLELDTPRKGEVRSGIIVSISPQGIIVDIEKTNRDGMVLTADVEGLDESERQLLVVGVTVPVKILAIPPTDLLSLSISQAKIADDWNKVETLLSTGEEIEIEITGYNKGGLIAPFGKIRGFIPLSQVGGFRHGLTDRERQRKMAKMTGVTLPAKVIEVDRQRKRLVFSCAKGYEKWVAEQKKIFLSELTVGAVLVGRVRNIQKFGVFVDLGEVDGLVHVSHLAWHRVKNPNELFSVGDKIDVQVLSINEDNNQIALSHRNCIDNPWDHIHEKYQEGQLIEGKIARIVDFGAFVELEPGVEGLLHITQLSHQEVHDIHGFVRKGEIHLLRVVDVEGEPRQRIRLSMKKVKPAEQIEWMQQKIDAETVTTDPIEVESSVEETISTVDDKPSLP